MTRNSIQSDFFINKVAKLSNQVRGQFCIVQCTDRGSYFVRDLYKLDSLELKFIATELYLLLPSFKSCELVDSPNIRYLN